MSSSNLKGVLTSFSPNLDLFAVTAGDGRIKIWDTVKGRVQTEFADIASTETTNVFMKEEGGHLSMDYTCMKWFSLEKKKKRKLGSSLLILGTGGGDVLALDVSAGQLKWRINNCHPGGVSAVSFPAHGSHIYTAGADGMVCEIDSISGNLFNKFTAASRPISSLAISPDGKKIATAASQLKIFNSSSHKKLQKFSGHPGPVSSMIFSEDGRYLLSSASGERYIAVWQIDGGKKKSASASLSMDHPAIFLDVKYDNSGDSDNASLCVFAISEIGVCYFWYGETIEELRNRKPTKIVVHADDDVLQKHKGGIPNVFAGKLQNVSMPGSGHIFLAYGFLIKPTFNKVLVHSGEDIKLNVSQDGILLPISQSKKSRKASHIQSQVTALDRSNIDSGLGPVPMMLNLVDGKSEVKPVGTEEKNDLDSVTLCMEDQLRALGILGSTDDTLISKLSSKGINLDASTPHKKMRSTVLSLEPSDAVDVLKRLVDVFESRSERSKHAFSWMQSIMLYHGRYVISKDSELLDSVDKFVKPRAFSMKSLLQLNGGLQLIWAQIDKAANKKSLVSERDEEEDGSEDEEEVDEARYGDADDDDDSETDSDSDES